MDVLLVGLDPDLREMRALIDSAGYHLAGEVVQRRPHPDPHYFVGKGKFEDLKKEVKEKGVGAVVFAGTLRASQHHELEKALGAQCYDRLRVILDIFTQRAHGREAKLQVELAMLQYEVPILKEWIHSGTAGERPGFMAGGEYRVDAYYETVKRRMKKIRDELEHLRNERAMRRDQRQARGFGQVSLAGYANAGKSSLFNALSGEQVQVDDLLFTTLSTTTRAFEGIRRPILLTDTVGLVSDVPLWLIEAFHSTFEEVSASDLILLLVDASDPIQEVREKVELAAGILLPGAEVAKVQPALTKTDLADAAKIAACSEVLRASVFTRPPLQVSARTGEGLAPLRDMIAEEFRYPLELVVRVPSNEQSESLLSWIHDRTDVLSVAPAGDGTEVRLRCRERDIPRIRAGARIVTGPDPVT